MKSTVASISAACGYRTANASIARSQRGNATHGPGYNAHATNGTNAANAWTRCTDGRYANDVATSDGSTSASHATWRVWDATTTGHATGG